jgi:hypothetical protein
VVQRHIASTDIKFIRLLPSQLSARPPATPRQQNQPLRVDWKQKPTTFQPRPGHVRHRISGKPLFLPYQRDGGWSIGTKAGILIPNWHTTTYNTNRRSTTATNYFSTTAPAYFSNTAPAWQQQCKRVLLIA